MGKFRDGMPVTERGRHASSSPRSTGSRRSSRARAPARRARRRRRRPHRRLETLSPQACGGTSPRPQTTAGAGLQVLERPLDAGRSLARRPRAGLPRDSRSGRRSAATGKPAAARAARGIAAERKPPTRRRSKAQTIRVNVDTLEHLMTMVSELVLTRNQLLEIARRRRRHRLQGAAAAPLPRHRRAAGRRHEDAHAADRQRLAEAAAGRARPLGGARKKIELVMQGAETELDRQVLEVIKDPLTHMVRNSADHGIENAARAQGRRQARAAARSASTPTTKAARSRSRSPTTAAASTSPRSARKARRARARGEAELERMSDAAGREVHLPSRLLDREGDHRRSPAAASAWTSSRPISS